jgi:hypothetical protein
MADDDHDRNLRGEIERRLLELRGKRPTSLLGRFSRTATARCAADASRGERAKPRPVLRTTSISIS